ncbi:HEPN domain-containing protein [Asticcacaulis sp.]|uniref:HEPN domain-containing protein n=1 Tax=Asticcacaulis sp. TaxID=1872648 RepID=UPI00262FC885|nr:HEPN domain-containing protein [Asticcacaulis sp.]
MANRLLEQAFELWIIPEVEARRAAGRLPDDFQLNMAQRIQRPDGTNLTRLNDEVRGLMQVGPIPGAAIGDDAYLDQITSIHSFDLIDEDLDSGHCTVIRLNGRWFTSFNFLTHRARCLDLLDKAKQFLKAAQDSIARGHSAVAVDTLFSACELVSKAELVSSHMLKMDSKSHGQIASSLNNWRKLGNIEGAFVDLFNRLGQLRPRYRYDAVFSELTPISSDDLDLVDAMIQDGIAKVSPHRPRDRSESVD